MKKLDVYTLTTFLMEQTFVLFTLQLLQLNN